MLAVVEEEIHGNSASLPPHGAHRFGFISTPFTFSSSLAATLSPKKYVHIQLIRLGYFIL